MPAKKKRMKVCVRIQVYITRVTNNKSEYQRNKQKYSNWWQGLIDECPTAGHETERKHVRTACTVRTKRTEWFVVGTSQGDVF